LAFIRTQETTSKMWNRTKNMLPAKPATRSLTRSDKVLCSKNSCSCFAMESICDCVCVELSLIKPLFSLPSEALPAAQLLFPFLIKCDEHCGELLAGSLPIQTERKAPWTNGTVALRAVCPLVDRGRVEDCRPAWQVQPIRCACLLRECLRGPTLCWFRSPALSNASYRVPAIGLSAARLKCDGAFSFSRFARSRIEQ